MEPIGTLAWSRTDAPYAGGVVPKILHPAFLQCDFINPFLSLYGPSTHRFSFALQYRCKNPGLALISCSVTTFQDFVQPLCHVHYAGVRPPPFFFLV